MDEAQSLHGGGEEDALHSSSTETTQGGEADRSARVHQEETVGRRRCTGGGGGEEAQTGGEERMLGPAEYEGRSGRDDELQLEEECKQKVLGVLRELRVFHSERVAAWREALTECACMLSRSPLGGGDLQDASTSGAGSNSFSDIFQSVSEDFKNLTQSLSTIVSKLEAEILRASADEDSAVDTVLQETRDPETSAPPEDGRNHPSLKDPLVSDCEREDEDERDQRSPSPNTEQTADTRFTSSSNMKETGGELEVKGQVGDNEEGCVSPVSQTDLLKETDEDAERTNVKVKEETKSEWTTVGLTGTMEDGQSHVPDACFIKGPVGAAEVLSCEIADALSCLMVTGAEELVSRVIRVKVQGQANFHFPVTLVVPFCARYRGSYRDVAVKIVDEERRASYVTPSTTEGTYGGQRGSFAEVRVYALGLFAVVSCLKRENYTVPRRGLSLKLSVDPRVCLSYLPGAFAAPVMAQTTIQPVDTVLLAAVKSRSEVYYPVASTSPLLHLAHPSSQPLRRPLTVTLPCPPNPERKRDVRGRGKQTERPHSGPVAPAWDQLASNRVSGLGASLKSPKETSKELLVVLVSRDKQWSVLERVTVRNLQNGLASFELTENCDRLLLVRLLSPLQPPHLTSLAERLEESLGCHAVTVVLQCRRDDPHAALVAALPGRDLSWELNKLRSQGYGGPLEASSDISMCEGDQLLLRFSGNITSTSTETQSPFDSVSSVCERLTFHTQRTNHLLVRLTEVDPFGNYSSPHYKGTAMFHKVTRGQLEWRGDGAALMDTKPPGDPVCALSLTLPKKVRSINRPVMARVKLCEETDSLSDSLLLWLAGELSAEEVAELVLSLRLRRSAAQLVRLRAGDSLTSQAFQVLATWRRGLPAAPHQLKASQLARCLAKSGRPDLARELLLRQAAATRQEKLT
ncbi:death domain-containing protein 1 [Pleuronectes platessa]|uniref:death domain-containing protein 1 n=1 Tax=Pleuronectes platessa TaxID=8262 RepID=UPI00232A2F89|nr:death domain-containing protein 1 [Pleuronectes platessa]